MKVLFTNNTLASRLGTELYVRDVALELARRGHQPMAYSTMLGAVAEEIRAAGVPVVELLSELPEPPDIIHGQHHYDIATALLWFPETPALYFCHGVVPWEEKPFRFPQVLRYVAVDQASRERLIQEGAVAEDDIEVVLNFYDPTRFPPRPSLPGKPRRALAFGNLFTASGALPALKEACGANGLTIDAVGLGVDSVAAEPGLLLAKYDVVFAVGRAAIEAMGVGAAVILCGNKRIGPLVTTENFEALRRINFGHRAITQPVTAAAVDGELRRYDALNADAVASHVRETCQLGAAVDRIVALYQKVLDEAANRPPPSPLERGRAVSSYLRQTADHHKISDSLRLLQQMADERLSLQQTADEGGQRPAGLERDLQAMQALAVDRERQINEIHASATWRWTQGLLRNSFVRRLFGRTIQRVAQKSRPAPGSAI